MVHVYCKLSRGLLGDVYSLFRSDTRRESGDTQPAISEALIITNELLLSPLAFMQSMKGEDTERLRLDHGGVSSDVVSSDRIEQDNKCHSTSQELDVSLSLKYTELIWLFMTHKFYVI